MTASGPLVAHGGERLEGAGIVGFAGKHHVGAAARQLRAVLEQTNVVGLHAFQLGGQASGEGRRVGEAAEAGEPRELVGVVRQRLGLLVGDHLQAMLDAAQEAIGLVELAPHLRPDPAARLEPLEREKRLRHAQVRLAAAGDQLLGLREELDLADAAASDLDVVPGHRDLAEAAEGVDLALHGVDVGDGREIQVLAPDEGGEAAPESPRPAAMSPAMARALMSAARSQFWPTLS